MRFIYGFLVILILFVACDSKTDNEVKGEWELIEFAIEGTSGNPVSNEETLRNAGAVWEMKFSGNGDFRQNFNMRTPEMEMETEEGTWKTTNDSLIVELQINNVESQLEYTYKIAGDTLFLTLAPKQSPAKVKTKFRRK